MQNYLEYLVKKIGMEDVNFFRPFKHFKIEREEEQQPSINLVGIPRIPLHPEGIKRDPRVPTKKNAVTTRDQSARLVGTKVGE